MSAKKDALRKAFTLYRESLCAEDKAAADAMIVSCVLHSEVYLSAETVFCYVSLPREIDTSPILSAAWRRGKTVAVPRCRKGGQMDFFAISSLDDLSRGTFGISEPGDDRPLCVPTVHDVCIVPCLAADAFGYRLGYGGGYYDRYLSLHPSKTIGLCYASCVAHALPHDEYDISLQMLITEKEVIQYG